jgi:hypothetical protein
LGQEFPSHTLFGSDGITPKDIKQGSIGNCWFMAAASAVAEKAHRLDRIFLQDETNESGIYALRLHALGVPTTLTIDDQLPIKETYGQKRTVFANFGQDGNSLWGPLLEKAFAKFHGNYSFLIGG